MSTQVNKQLTKRLYFAFLDVALKIGANDDEALSAAATLVGSLYATAIKNGKPITMEMVDHTLNQIRNYVLIESVETAGKPS